MKGNATYLKKKYMPDSSHRYKEIMRNIYFSFHKHRTCTTKLNLGLEPFDCLIDKTTLYDWPITTVYPHFKFWTPNF